jgi:hypothetical protein
MSKSKRLAILIVTYLKTVVKDFNAVGFELNESVVEFNKNEDCSLITIKNGSADPRLIKIQRGMKGMLSLLNSSMTKRYKNNSHYN